MARCYLKDYFGIPFHVVPGIHLASWRASSGSFKVRKIVNFCKVSFLPVPFPDLNEIRSLSCNKRVSWNLKTTLVEYITIDFFFMSPTYWIIESKLVMWFKRQDLELY